MRVVGQVYNTMHVEMAKEMPVGTSPCPMLKWIPELAKRKLNGGKHAT
jgi:hypothetical protein